MYVRIVHIEGKCAAWLFKIEQTTHSAAAEIACHFRVGHDDRPGDGRSKKLSKACNYN
jgi:hypothetical protein